MSNDLTTQQYPGSVGAGMRGIVLVAMIVLVWSTRDTNNARARSSAPGNRMTQMANVRNSGNLLWGSPQSFVGPRPYIDVTAYGCKGDAATNDTACIQAAMSAACAFTVGGQRVHPIVVFPPGYYIVSQPQNPSRAPVFEIPCSNLTIRGMGTSGRAAFSRAPQVIIQSIPGASPNAAPVFDVRAPNAGIGVTFQDLQIFGYNEALWIYDSVENKLDDVTLNVRNTPLPDNSALKLTNLFWFEWNGGTCEIQGAFSPNKYCILMTGDVPLTKESPLVGLFHIHDVQGSGGTIRYDQRVNANGGGPGNWVFENLRGWEATQGPFILITNSTGNSGSVGLPAVSNITLNNVSSADSFGQYPLIEFQPSGSNLQGVIIDESIGGIGGSAAIQMDAGMASNVFGCNIRNGANTSFSAWAVVDASGNPMPGCSITNVQGFDFVTANTGSSAGNLRSDIFPQSAPAGPAIRLTLAPNRFSGVALDPTFGLMLNTGSDFGFGGGIGQPIRGAIDVEFPKNYPPTSLMGAPTTGGSIAAGTYYGTVYSSTSSATCNAAQSAPSMQSSAIILSGGNNAINWSWTLPIAGVNSVRGYCVSVSTTPSFNKRLWNPQQTNWQFVTGGTTNTLAMTILPTTGGLQPLQNTLLPAHRFTPNALGIDTTSPVAHTLTQNGGYVCPIATKSSAYTLTTGDCRIQVTGTTTITIPHTLPAAGLTNIWHVFSVSGTTTLICDSGTINESPSITIINNTGKDAYADGENCFAQ